MLLIFILSHLVCWCISWPSSQAAMTRESSFIQPALCSKNPYQRFQINRLFRWFNRQKHLLCKPDFLCFIATTYILILQLCFLTSTHLLWYSWVHIVIHNTYNTHTLILTLKQTLTKIQTRKKDIYFHVLGTDTVIVRRNMNQKQLDRGLLTFFVFARHWMALFIFFLKYAFFSILDVLPNYFCLLGSRPLIHNPNPHCTFYFRTTSLNYIDELCALYVDHIVLEYMITVPQLSSGWDHRFVLLGWHFKDIRHLMYISMPLYYRLLWCPFSRCLWWMAVCPVQKKCMDCSK